MKKFKRGFFSGFTFMMLEIICPAMVSMLLLFLMDGEPFWETLGMMLMTLVAILLLFIAMHCIVNLIAWPFCKYILFMDEESFSYKDKRIRYQEVTEIVFDSGFPSKTGGGDPCCLDFYAGRNILMTINNPSLIMTFLMIRRCKNAKLCYRRIKRAIITWIAFLVIFTALGLYGRFGGQ